MSISSVQKKPSQHSWKNLKDEQVEAIDRLYCFDHTLLVAHMGSGKTVTALSAVSELLHEGHIKRLLIVAPKKVCESVWSCEHLSWDHLEDLNIVLATGTPKQREAALVSPANIVVTNFENLVWLTKQPLFKHFDGLLIDELTKLKGGGAGFKALRKHLDQFTWRTGMTGTLVSENLESLFYQAMIIDGGKTFGKNRQKFLLKYFYATDYNGYNWAVKPEMDKEIVRLFKPYTHSMEDYRHTLPPLTHRVIATPLPVDARNLYDNLRKNMGDDDLEVYADNMAVLSGKLQQVASGFLYRDSDEHDTVQVHNAKEQALDKLKKKIGKNYNNQNAKIGKNYNNQNIIIVYQFRAELSRLQAMFPHAPVLGAGVTPERLNVIVGAWNSGQIPVLLLHPKSAGHGLNLAKGGSRLIWFSPVWSRDLYDQTNARLWRRGQTQPVEIIELIAPDTVEVLVAQRLDSKKDYMAAFLAHLKD